MTKVILASRSPRRTQLLEMLGVAHEAVPSNVPEDALPGEGPRAQVLRLAGEKAERVAALRTDGDLVIGADTLVVLEGIVLGQPRDEKDARRMLAHLSGATHTVLTGLCLLGPAGRAAEVSESRVTFHHMSATEIGWYVATGEPMDKAGAYAAQGVGAAFLEAIEGSFHNVVGFPVDLFYQLLPEVGLSLDGLRRGGL